MDVNDAVGAGRRAQELRATLTARLDVESMLAEAGAARQAAVVDADAIVAHAQQVAEQLLSDTRTEAEALVAQARGEAEEALREARSAAQGVRARAESDVEEHRRRVRAEVTEQVTRDVLEQARAETALMREQSVGMLGDLEASVQILGVSLDTAQTNVGDLLARLRGLRIHAGESVGEARTEPSRALEREQADGDERIDHWTRRDDEDGADGSGADRADSAADPTGAEADADDPDDPDDPEEDPPRTATEAYLRSVHIDFGDPPLPPIDDTDVAARYGRDVQDGATRPRLRAAADLPDDDDEVVLDRRSGADGTAGRPLGWLFRSPS